MCHAPGSPVLPSHHCRRRHRRSQHDIITIASIFSPQTQTQTPHPNTINACSPFRCAQGECGCVVQAVAGREGTRISVTAFISPDGTASLVSSVEHVENAAFAPVAYRWPQRNVSQQAVCNATASIIAAMTQDGIVGYVSLLLECIQEPQRLRVISFALGMDHTHSTCCMLAAKAGFAISDNCDPLKPPMAHCVFTAATKDINFSFVKYAVVQRCLDVRRQSWSPEEGTGFVLLPVHPEHREHVICASVGRSPALADAVFTSALTHLCTDIGSTSTDPAMSSLRLVATAIQKAR